jgi:hypothetical protein
MTSQIPFTPVTPEALARLTAIERLTFQTSAGLAAAGQKPSLESVVILLEIIQRLIAEPAGLTAEGSGPLLDDRCRAGECGTCPGAPCEHECHREAGRG